MTTGPMITTQGLAKTFTKKKETVEAVRGIDLSVAEGELVAFLGPNGAGKSTTLRMLTGLLAPTAGRATVAGYDVVAQPDKVRQTIGYIGQGNSAGYYFRVADELASQAQFYGVPAAEGRKRAAACWDGPGESSQPVGARAADAPRVRHDVGAHHPLPRGGRPHG